MEKDVRCPGVSAVTGDHFGCPLGSLVENLPGRIPSDEVIGSEDTDAETGAEQIPAAVTVSGYRIVC